MTAHNFRLTVFIPNGDSTRYIYFIRARSFLAAMFMFETQSAFECYELISIERIYDK